MGTREGEDTVNQYYYLYSYPKFGFIVCD